ncbi:hypothetical protein, partial [Proteus mirabilis]|uniref:hypothetical protein n=1 Tax=Proteus mirabilis TaxID=584 RepID=UPI0025779ED8
RIAIGIRPIRWGIMCICLCHLFSIKVARKIGQHTITTVRIMKVALNGFFAGLCHTINFTTIPNAP